MSSIKLFNFKYAKQNLKKELGILTIFFLIIPLINIVVIYNYSIKSYNYMTPFSMKEIIMPSLMGMFLLPFILSNILLGYVYSQKQIDFINSMPLSRKKIFLTNILIGIVYIILMQLFSLLIQTIFINISNIIVVNFAMLFDMFLAMTIGYVFVFIVSTLALAFTGNTVIQFIVVLLLLFLIPFIRILYFTPSQEYVYLVTSNGEEYKYYYCFMSEELPIYTTPIASVLSIINDLSIYNVKSFIITIFLSVVYIVIGVKLFERRKMEEVGHSFLNTKIHLLIKSITLFPIVALLFKNRDDLTIVHIGFAICLIFGYYCLFDLLTSKKVKFKVTICAFLISNLAILGVVIGSNKINENILSKRNVIHQDDIKSITVSADNIFNAFKLDGIELSGEDMKLIIDNLRPDTTIDSNDNYFDFYELQVKLKLKNGKIVPAYIGISEETIRMLLEKIKDNKNYLKEIEKYYEIDDKTLINSYLDMEFSSLKNQDELINEINKISKKYIELEIQNKLDGLDSELGNLESNSSYIIRDEIRYNYLFQYKNHKSYNICMREYEETKELNDKLIMFFNKVHRDSYEKLNEDNLKTHVDKTSIFVRRLENGTFERGHLGLDVLSDEGIRQLVKEEYLKEFDSSKPFYSFRSNFETDTLFYTNNVERVEEIIEKYTIEETFEKVFYYPNKTYYE